MMVLDSNVWIAYFDEDDSQHGRARSILAEAVTPIAVTEYVIIEVCTVLSFKTNKRIVNRFLDLVLDNTDINILLSDRAFFSAVVNLFSGLSNNKLSFTDASLLYLAKLYKIETFDRTLAREIDQTRF